MYLYQTMKKSNDNVNYEKIPQQNLKVIRSDTQIKKVSIL